MQQLDSSSDLLDWTRGQLVMYSVNGTALLLAGANDLLTKEAVGLFLDILRGKSETGTFAPFDDWSQISPYKIWHSENKWSLCLKLWPFKCVQKLHLETFIIFSRRVSSNDSSVSSWRHLKTLFLFIVEQHLSFNQLELVS